MQYTILGLYFDDNNIPISGSNKEKNVKIITFRLRITTQWFYCSCTNLNPEKCSCLGQSSNDDGFLK